VWAIDGAVREPTLNHVRHKIKQSALFSVWSSTSIHDVPPTPTPLSAPLGTTPYRICFTNIKNIYINGLNTFSSDLIPFCCSVSFFCAIFSLLCLPSPDEVASWPPRTASVLQVNWLTWNIFCTVRYWSVCIYILQINLKKTCCGGEIWFWISLHPASANVCLLGQAALIGSLQTADSAFEKSGC
jgi:hypothetical protein